jgi:hypothetical protein
MLLVVLAGLAAGGSARAAPAGDVSRPDGVVYRYYARYGYRFQPLASFAELNRLVSLRAVPRAARLATALVGRGVRRAGALYWEYDFPYGGPAPCASGFVQAVAAQALARVGALAGRATFSRAATSAFRALRPPLVMPVAGGLWVREYGFSTTKILNAQLQSILALESYGHVAESRAGELLAAKLYIAALASLPQLDLGCWSRYSLGGAAATARYHAYHVELLRQLAQHHPEDREWQVVHSRWSRCLP